MILKYAITQTIQPLYVGDKNLRTVLLKLEEDALLLSEWFSDNFMKQNEEKSHL